MYYNTRANPLRSFQVPQDLGHPARVLVVAVVCVAAVSRVFVIVVVVVVGVVVEVVVVAVVVVVRAAVAAGCVLPVGVAVLLACTFCILARFAVVFSVFVVHG